MTVAAILGVSSAVPASATTTFADAFDRPDGPLGSPWVAANSTWGVRSGAAQMLRARWADTIAAATVDSGLTEYRVSADVRLSPTFRRANAGLVIASVSVRTHLFCKIEVTAGNPDGLMSIGRRVNGKTTSLLATIRNAGFTNGTTYPVTCGRSGNVVTMTVGTRTLRYTMSSSDVSRFGSATAVGMRVHVAPDEDDGLSTFDNVVVDDLAVPPPTTPAITVAAAGDICGATTTALTACAATADLIRARAPDLVLALGDTVYDSGTMTEFTQRYDPRWGSLVPITWPVPGNHEYDDPTVGPGAEGYRAYFPDSVAPASGPLYYSLDAGAWHLVGLDTDPVQPGEGQPGVEAGTTQAEWEAADLAADGHACSLVYGHHPRWSSPDGPTTVRHGSQTHVDAVWRRAVADGVDVWLAGHNHDYERFERLDGDGAPDANGTREFVVGTGGAALSGFDAVLTTSEFRASTHGVLFLTLGQSSYSWSFEDTTGAVLDAGGPVPC